MKRTFAKCATTTKYNIRKEALSEVQINPVDSINDYLVYTSVFLTNQFRVEQNFWRAETFRSKLFVVSKNEKFQLDPHT